MKPDVLQQAAEYTKTHHQKKRWQKVVTCLAAVVVFCTTYALILPAITMEKQCPIPEHTHTQACYTQVTNLEKKVPICTKESLNLHRHTDACYADGELVCGYADFVVHEHDESCYDADGKLWCPLPEIKAHTHSGSCWTTPETQPVHVHTDACYQWEQGALICGETEREGHTHGDSCYLVDSALTCQTPETPGHQHDDSCYETTLVCGRSEGDGAHTHSDGCYDAEGNLVCGQAESSGHVHGDGCWQKTLVCGIEAGAGGHTHSEGCYTVTKTLTCEIPEDPGHQHTADCYEKIRGELICTESTETEAVEPELTCEKEEIILHQHGPGCYDENGALICGQMQILEHRHTDACFETLQEPVDTETLTCGKEAGEGAHTHGEECYNENGELTCELEESEGHVHTALCYGTWELTCGMTEHTHSEACTGSPEDTQPHVHSEACYDENGNLICGLEADETQPVPLPLAGDDAVVSQLAVESTQIIPGIPRDAVTPKTTDSTETDPETAALTAQNQDSIHYTITGTIDTYADACYLDGRVRFEFVLPLTPEQAVFDLEAMSWPDNSEGYAPILTTENRIIGGQETSCQVLTLWLHLTPEAQQESVIPGEFSVISAVKVENMAHNDSISLEISAAMEFSVWEDVCPVHQIAEKRTITTQTVTVIDPAMLADYQTLLAELEVLEATDPWDDAATAQAEDLLQRVMAAYEAGLLSEEEFLELQDRLVLLLYGDVNSLAEPAIGTNWMTLRDSGWFSAYSGSAAASSVSRSSLRYAAARGAALLDAGDTAPSSAQIVSPGGSNTSDDGHVTVSKTIAGTELENVFDITLQVQTGEKIAEQYEEPDMAVVIVMDISNTMKENFGDTTRYAAAMTAAEKFLDEFAENNSMGISKVGYVAFNTDAHQIFGLQPCTNASQASALKNTMRTRTGAIINQDGYASSHSRFTNVEAGLKMASDMLSGASNKNKYIIFLSDGFPTTYVSGGYSGYDPYTGSGTVGTDGVFHDDVLNKYCTYGTSYSDKAAIRARNMASSIKASGTTIFSIGVDVGGQTVQQYVESSEKSNGFSVVDRTSTTYEIGDASSTSAYQNWLRNGIGSGYYYNSTDSAGLSAAYDQIFAEIKHLVGIGSQADWVANDPLPSITGSSDAVEFIGFFDRTPTLVSGDLSGSYTPGGENTAAFQNDSNAIKWDLKNSSYQSTTDGTATTYLYQLRYRVRLKNENGDFVERQTYPTNDTTTLQYRYFETTDGTIQVSDPKTINFPIPAVKGYLAELTFQKVDSDGHKLEGAEFTLRHDAQNCSVCRGDGTSVTIPDFTAVSDAEGAVTFQHIPSGHKYVLEETRIPAGYSTNGDSYSVEVAYDTLTVTVKAYDGSAGEWNGEIVNNIYYELPSTGGTGTQVYTAGGTLLIAAGVLLYLQTKRKRRKVTPS